LQEFVRVALPGFNIDYISVKLRGNGPQALIGFRGNVVETNQDLVKQCVNSPLNPFHSADLKNFFGYRTQSGSPSSLGGIKPTAP